VRGVRAEIERTTISEAEGLTMQRTCLALLRFALSAWVGIAIFFVTVILGLRQSELFDRLSKFNHPKVLFPLYYGFEFTLLGIALICAAAGLWTAAAGAARRYLLLALVGASFAVALLDYAVVYRELVKILADPEVIPAAQFAARHQASRRLNEAMLAFSIAAAIVAHWPVGQRAADSRRE
jgi:hypothetical protein